MSDVTQIISKIESGESSAAEELLPLVYNELRKLAMVKLAHEKPGQTLQATALVHDAYIRLVDEDQLQNWNSRGHFFAAASEAMRCILVERARHKQTLKKGGGKRREHAPLDEFPTATEHIPEELLAIHEVLDQLAAVSPRKAELVKLRYFLGCTIAESAQLLQIAPKTAEDDWTYARAWLRRRWLIENKNLSDL